MMLGIYKNYDELEEHLSLPEIEALLSKVREEKHEDRKFAAALEGIDLDEGQKSSAQEAFERAQARADAVLGKTKQKEMEEWDAFGLEIETDGEN